ncbi:diguanylate cyclase domain-containing protein [Luteimonas saliphila]|uniref:diguanylate cyclase domain-containing protein n=1 Tax=Luteimonas saliphila TaxID=2804919 RepID=UPI00192E263E|nr:diguanylate cyclase [Luteimonas saliphila]
MAVPGNKKDGSATEEAARDLSRLQEQAGQARADLVRLQQQVVEAENRLDSRREAQLVEVNEQLLCSALAARVDADTCKETLQEMSRSQGHDALTELPNRLLLLDRFAQAIAHANRHGTRLALLFLDIDHFKQINDTFGHPVGDEVLKLAARRLTAAVRDVDTVSRHGGDEFLILLTELSQAADAVDVAHKLTAALGVPDRVGGHVLRLTASIGISIYPEHGEDADTLIDHADAAMYGAKRRGLGNCVFSENGTEDARSPGVAALRHPLTPYELALVEHDRRYEQLREANEQLVLAALTAQDLQAAAQRSQRQQKEFLAMMAHELRNPLTSIRLASTMLAQSEGGDPARMQAIIEREVTHMARVVSDLLDISRANTGKLRLERCTVDLAGIVDAAIDACRPAMDMRLQQLTVQLPVRAVAVDGDPVRLVQVLSNLLDNASKYTPEAGRIGLSVAVLGDTVAITVADSGIGISAEALPDVFEPFVQEGHAIGFNGVGLGIGLTVVRELVEAHGGSVVATSAGPGQGSRFVVTLPLLR